MKREDRMNNINSLAGNSNKFKEGTQYLCSVDPKLQKLILTIEDYSFVLEENYYESLIKKIVGQQLSIKAANSIVERIKSHCKIIKPDAINKMTDAELKVCGVSRPKISFIRDLTGRVINKEMNLDELKTKNDDDVIKILTEVKGIGQWTAEMFLIFSLGRTNVLSLLDVSIKRAINWLYCYEKVNYDDLFKLWSPYNTIASLYLWEIVNRNYINNYENIDQV